VVGDLGGGMYALLGTRLCPDIEMVLDAISFDRLLDNTDLVITDEGRLDQQTSMGKASGGVLKHAVKMNVPVIAFRVNMTMKIYLTKRGCSPE